MFRGKPARDAREGRRQKAEGRTAILQSRFFLFCLLPSAFCLLLLTGCRQKMANQPRYDPLEPSTFFQDGMSARPRLAGTVARGELSTDPFLDTGKINGQVADGFPFAVTAEVIDRGQERYNIYCTPCHGRLGDGNGMIPARGLRRPPSFHTQTLRTATTGHFFDVMTNGFGAMPPYAGQVTAKDRWAIVAYIRALQLSQNATAADVPAADRAKLDQPAEAQVPGHAAPNEAAKGPHGGSH